MLKRERRADARGGFTLMELLVVVAIIVVLAGAAVPMYMNYLENSKKKMAWANAKVLAQTADAYRIDMGDYPSTLNDMIQPPNNHLPYLEASSLRDPWDHEYQYAYPGQHNTQGKPDVWSLGGRIGDQSGIIGNWMPSP
jgi:general secretion pathway protein G